jgi:type I restriction-modification system DNA methylase subunit
MTKKEDNIKINKKEIMASLINLLKWCLDLLRNQEHITGKEALKIITTLLSYKLIENKIDWSNYKIDLSIIDIGNLDEKEVKERIDTLYKNVKFSNYAINDDDNYNMSIMNIWDLMLAKHEKTKEIFKLNKHTILSNLKNETLKKLIKKINKIKLEEDEDLDINGAAYEEVIKDIMTGKVLGQYFTQPIVKNIVIDLIKPQMNESIYDPAMGTGGFLISAIRYLKKNNKDFDITKIKISGREADEDTYQLAMANMLISLGETINLEKGDSLREVIRESYDIVMANPPFGIKGINYNELNNYNIPIKSASSVNLFIQLIINILNKEGRAGVVLPDGKELFGNSKELIKIREYLLKSCDVKEIIYLPSDSFNYTTIRTCVIYFKKKKEEEEIILKKNKWIEEYETKSIKFYEYINEEKKNLLVEVDIKELIENNLSLNYKLYLKKEEREEKINEEIKYMSIGEICEIQNGKRIVNGHVESGEYPVLGGGGVTSFYTNIYTREEETCKISREGMSLNNCVMLLNYKYYLNSQGFTLISKDINILNKYIWYYLDNNKCLVYECGRGTAQIAIDIEEFKRIKLPIPSKERQAEVINYLELIIDNNDINEKKIINLKKLNEYYIKREMKINNNLEKLKNICILEIGGTPSREKKEYYENGNNLWVSVKELNGGYIYNTKEKLTEEGVNNSSVKLYEKDTVLFSFKLSIGKTAIAGVPLYSNEAIAGIKSKDENILKNKYLYYYLRNNNFTELGSGIIGNGSLNKKTLNEIKILILSKEKQEEIINYCEYNDRLIKQLEEEIEKNKLYMKKIIDEIK